MDLLDVLLPPACAGCSRSGHLLCGGCRDDMRAPSEPAHRFFAPDAGVIVGDALAVGLAAFAYEGPTRRALAALKYRGARRLAPLLASAAAPRLADLVGITGPATLVPVPVHLVRMRERGYNQADLLARELGRRSRLPLARSLARVRSTPKQHRLNRAARLANLRGAFAVVIPPPASVILVDDIITTTATLEACAGTLQAAGVGAVAAFAIAREV